uniref:Uncharacterized protein n=1 Tax=Anguilla anguilla TaxID=7936 RepID=A0A0E9THW0_ANGAN
MNVYHVTFQLHPYLFLNVLVYSLHHFLGVHQGSNN